MSAADVQRYVAEFQEAAAKTDSEILFGTGSEEERMLTDGLAYEYTVQGILGATVSLASCIELNQIRLAKTLLKYGYISMDEQISPSWSLLHLAAMFNRPDFVRLLSRHGLDVNCRGGKIGLTPLHEAIRTGSLEAATALLDCGADIEMEVWSIGHQKWVDAVEFSLLKESTSPSVLKLLLERGAKYGHTTSSKPSSCRDQTVSRRSGLTVHSRSWYARSGCEAP